MYGQGESLDSRQAECCTQCLQGGNQLDAAGYADHGLCGYRHKGHRALHHAPKLFLDIPQRVL